MEALFIERERERERRSIYYKQLTRAALIVPVYFLDVLHFTLDFSTIHLNA